MNVSKYEQGWLWLDDNVKTSSAIPDGNFLSLVRNKPSKMH
jgi:hypothetical protein